MGSHSVVFYALLSFGDFSGLLVLVAWLFTLCILNSLPYFCSLSVFFYFTTLLSIFHHSEHSSVGLSLFGLHVKEHDAGACVSPANANRAQNFFVLPPPIFVFAQTECFFSPTKAWTQKNMLMLCPPKGFMHLFSSLLFKAFNLTLMFSLYHATILWLLLARGQSVQMHVYFVLPVISILRPSCVFTILLVFIGLGTWCQHLHIVYVP